MTELADFLLARIAEDAFVAFLAGRDEELLGPLAQHVISEDDHRLPHAARWRPDVVKEHCDARRRIVEEHAGGGGPLCDVCCEHDGPELLPQRLPCPTLRLLALPYADHPDYREEWLP